MHAMQSTEWLHNNHHVQTCRMAQ